MYKRLTVISGAYFGKKTFNLLREYAREIHPADSIDVISRANADIALANATEFGFTAQELFQQREIIRKDIFSSWRSGSRACLIVAELPDLEALRDETEQIKFIQREQAEVHRWHCFPQMISASCYPSLQHVELVAG